MILTALYICSSEEELIRRKKPGQQNQWRRANWTRSLSQTAIIPELRGLKLQTAF